MTALAALWGLIPTKDKLYGLAIVLILVAFWAFTVHERSVGGAAVSRTQSAAAAKQADIAAKKTAVGATNSTTAEVRYVSTINAVIPDSPHLLVLDSGTAAAAVCAAAYPTERDDPSESSVEHPRDIGPDLDKIGRDSDAQVILLQSVLKSCVEIGACKVTN